MDMGVAEKIDDLTVIFLFDQKGILYQNKDLGSFYRSMVLLHHKVI